MHVQRRSLAAAFAVLVGCNGPTGASPTPSPTLTPAPAPAPTPPATDPVTPPPGPDVRPAAPSVPVIDPQVLAAAEQDRGTPEGAQRAGERLRAGATGSELWGAVYVYAADGDDPALLEPLLAGPDASIKVLAAGGLLRLGRKSAFPALVAEVGNTDILAGSEPPQPIGEVAAIMLAMASGQQLDITAGPAAQKAWSDWYAAGGDRLAFDREKGWIVQ